MFTKTDLGRASSFFQGLGFLPRESSAPCCPASHLPLKKLDRTTASKLAPKATHYLFHRPRHAQWRRLHGLRQIAAGVAESPSRTEAQVESDRRLPGSVGRLSDGADATHFRHGCHCSSVSESDDISSILFRLDDGTSCCCRQGRAQIVEEVSRRNPR